MSYHPLTSGERYMLSALRKQGCTQAEIARQLDRHRSTISRELRRNCSRWDGHYRPAGAADHAETTDLVSAIQPGCRAPETELEP
jgi:transposase, IS30 family